MGKNAIDVSNGSILLTDERFHLCWVYFYWNYKFYSVYLYPCVTLQHTLIPVIFQWKWFNIVTLHVYSSKPQSFYIFIIMLC